MLRKLRQAMGDRDQAFLLCHLIEIDDAFSGGKRGQVQLVQRIGFNKAVVAVVNKMARVALAVLAKEVEFDPALM